MKVLMIIIALVFTFDNVDTEIINKGEVTKPCIVAEYAAENSIVLQVVPPCTGQIDFCMIAEPCPYVGVGFLVCIYPGEPITIVPDPQ